MRELVRGLLKKLATQSVVLRAHYSADPERDPASNPGWREQERRKYSSQGAWDREQEVIHEAGGGERVFAEVFSRWSDKIIVDGARFQPSPHWRRIGGFDHGKANPTAALVGCVDFDGVIYLTGESYQPGFSPNSPW
jgi:hypothetical protein